MAEVISSYGEVNPQHYYSPEAAARALGMSKRWVMVNLIRDDAVDYHRKGDFISIPGWVLAQWIESDLRKHSEWQENGESEPEPETPKSASKRSNSKPGSATS